MANNEPIEGGVAAAANAVPWWRDAAGFTKVAALITSVVTALAGFGTVGTSYLVEKTKLRAQVESLEAKRISDSEDRKDKNAAAERELRTKYVDLALQPTLGIDHRARIFGYLSTVLEDRTQRDWALKEAKKADEQSVYLWRLRLQLDQAIENHDRSLQRYLKELDLADVVRRGLKAQYENEEERIKSLRSRILELQAGVTRPGPQASEVATGTERP
jgi:hypothetical protein